MREVTSVPHELEILELSAIEGEEDGEYGDEEMASLCAALRGG